ncbi:MAG: hypothetical protein WA093_02915 [Minisyncoccales bacterium]
MIKVKKSVLIPAVGLILFAAIAAGAYFWMPAQFRPLKTMKADDAAKKAIDYVNKNMLSQGMVATYKDVKSENGMYTFKLTVQEKDYAAYVTKDGALFFAEGIPQAIPLDKSLESESANADIAKTDKPDVKVFVMSYCPYGLQAQKMYLPVYDLLKDKAAIGIYFVNYAMHGKKELDENLRQYCIQKDQSDKYAAYLKCFTIATTAADGTAGYAKCLTSAGVDQSKLGACTAAVDKEFKITADYNDKTTWISEQFPKFAVNDDLNTKYGVQGSPTIVINDTDVSSSLASRSPEAFKQLICSAFNTQPSECGTVLSDDQPSTGFGAGTAANTGAAEGCATN